MNYITLSQHQMCLRDLAMLRLCDIDLLISDLRWAGSEIQQGLLVMSMLVFLLAE